MGSEFDLPPRSTVDPGQPLSPAVSAADLPRSAVDLAPRSAADHRTYHSFEPVSEPVIEPSAPGASPAASEGDYLGADEPETPKTEKGESGADLLARIPADMPGTRDPNAKTFKAWANYAIAYRNRYKTWPVSNQKTSAMLAQLVDRVGAELAPKVAAFYLQMNQQFYLTKLHPVSLLLADCEAIATQCTTGQQVTHAQSRQMDSTQTNLSNLEQAKAMLRERQAKREASSCH